jgi:uncharacterized membrane protein YfcA
MGLLIFGTPTLVILGFDFVSTLATLLPASITISLLQIIEDKSMDPNFASRFAIWGLPSAGLGLVIVVQYEPRIPLELLLGSLLLFFASLRFLPNFSELITTAVRRHVSVWMIAMGLVHGLSNLGGSVLSMVTSAFFKDKNDIRKTIAFCYFCFAAIQIFILVVARPGLFGVSQVLIMVLAATVYMAVGRISFQFISQPAYERLFTGFMYLYAVILLSKGTGLICATCE